MGQFRHSIVVEGYNNYVQIIRDLNIEPRNLQHNKMPLNLRNFMHSPVDLHTSVVQNMGYGVVGMPSDPDSGSFSLLSGFNHVFSQSQFVLATFGEYTVALIYQFDAGNYFIFDSHACNGNGITDSAGTSVLLEFSSLNDLEEHLTVVSFGCRIARSRIPEQEIPEIPEPEIPEDQNKKFRIVRRVEVS